MAARLSTVVLSWNRPALLRRTLLSYRATTRSRARLLVVDNGSGQETMALIESAKSSGLIDAAICLPGNEGGLALNHALPFLDGDYIHFSENDVEYRAGWDARLLAKFAAFPWLGQLSPFGPAPEAGGGEVWVAHDSDPLCAGGQRIFVTRANVGTTCVIPRQVAEVGIRWRNIEAGRWRWPDDAAFSARIQAQGRLVAWNDSYAATNWGHNVAEWNRELPYYLESYAAKPWVGIGGLEQRLRQAGHEFVRTGDGKIVRITQRPAPGWSSAGSPMDRGSRNDCRPSGPSSRPRPDSLKPPNGTSGNGG